MVKAASSAGLGLAAVRNITTHHLQMDVEELSAAVVEDVRKGFYPLMIVATMGTTGAGAIDPIAESE